MMNVNADNLGGWSISLEMFDWILQNIPKSSFILEFGAGKGTIELANYYKVISIEQDKQWAYLTDKAEYHIAPLIRNWYSVNVVKKAIDRKDIKLIIVDGPSGSGNRNGLVHFLLRNPVLRTDIIIIDDVHRENERILSEKIASLTKRKATYVQCSDKSFCII
jgi:hypothetical protein